MLAEIVGWMAGWFALPPVSSGCCFAGRLPGVAWTAHAAAIRHVVGAAAGDGDDVVDLVAVDEAAGQPELALPFVSLDHLDSDALPLCT
jgi:hypothetical protein